MDKDLFEFEANFSVLDRYGTDVTKEEYVTDPAIGREEQIKELIIVLLTPEKSAILIGKPGIGKTAIVEGLAYRLQNNDVPDALQGYSIINIKTASLLGTMPSGESKVQKMIDELKTREKLILFIDEIHMLIGATDSSSLDFANIFKEGLGRGSIKVIGATTTEEYERYVLRDKAFTRRFQKIDVPEPSRDETVKIMMGTLPKFEKLTGRKMKYTDFIQERIMGFIVDITSEYKRVYALGSRYPDVSLTLLKQAFSYTVYDNREYVDIFDVRKAIENSKSIYPDVINKELPNFDKMFNDLILEENGEKPVEEWRKNDAPVRNDVENNEEEVEDVNYSTAENRQPKKNPAKIIMAPTNNRRFVQSPGEMKRMNENRNFNNGKGAKINSNVRLKNDKAFAQFGISNSSINYDDKIRRSSDSSGLDDILLGSDVGLLKAKNNDGPRIPKKAVVTDEIRNGVSDSFLLGRPVSSTIDRSRNNKPQEVVRYRIDGRSDNRQPNFNNDRGQNNSNYRPNRIDISEQNFDKYNNYFRKDDLNYNAPVDPRNMNQNNRKKPNNNWHEFNERREDDNKSNNSYGPTVNIAKSILKMEDEQRENKSTGGLVSLSVSGNESLFEPIVKDTELSPEKMDIQKLIGKDISEINILTENYNKDNNVLGASVQSGVSFKKSKNMNLSTDIFGNLSENNLRIKNGKVIDEFPAFDKLDNLSNIKSVIGDVQKVSEEKDEHKDKKWTFLPSDDEENNGVQNDVLSSNNNNDETTISPVINNIEPTSNADYNEDIKNAEFVDFSELKNGQVKEEDTNKFLGIPVSENKTTFDLNIENNNVKEVDFDDFYDQ